MPALHHLSAWLQFELRLPLLPSHSFPSRTPTSLIQLPPHGARLLLLTWWLWQALPGVKVFLFSVFLPYLNFPRAFLRFFFSRFYFLLIIFNFFFGFSILALAAFSPSFLFARALLPRQLLLASGRLFLGWTLPAFLDFGGTAASRLESPQVAFGWLLVKLYIYTCGALIFFFFSLEFFFSAALLCEFCFRFFFVEIFYALHCLRLVNFWPDL